MRAKFRRDPTAGSKKVTFKFISRYALLKVVSHYDLSVLSMSYIGFQKKFLHGGEWVG